MSAIPRILAIGGSDSGGGAGIQADIKTVTAMGGYAATAITAVTVQDTLGVHAVHAVPPELIAAQIGAVLDDIGADAVKIGMVGDAAAFAAVARALAPHAAIPRIVDPVMAAKGGAALIDPGAIEGLRRLIEGAALVTPNAPEAAFLTGQAVEDLEGQRAAARTLIASGARAVLVKGGHVPGPRVIDLLVSAAGETIFEGPRIETHHTHGTGCTLSSACAVGVARGLPLAEAVARAWAFTAEAIRNAPGFGSGAGPLGHARREGGR